MTGRESAPRYSGSDELSSGGPSIYGIEPGVSIYNGFYTLDINPTAEGLMRMRAVTEDGRCLFDEVVPAMSDDTAAAPDCEATGLQTGPSAIETTHAADINTNERTPA